jgi:tryptophan 2,3-dioxygenase
LQIAVHRTNRIVEIWKLLVSQVDVLETMTPMDFLDFRDLLTPASGFQSVQFRELETKLGLKMENRHEQRYYEHQLCPAHVTQIKELDTKESLLDLLEQWLERTPIWAAENWNDFEVPEGAKEDIHPFWATYRHTFESGLVSQELAGIKMGDFDSLILGEGEQDTRLSAASLQAALFITLYRDYPLMQMPYQLLSKWLEIDELMASWRYRHMSMVRRMIGMRVGTGGSTGASYLKGAMEKHHIFGDFTRITTYLIPRAKLPKLPPVLEQKLRFTAI